MSVIEKLKTFFHDRRDKKTRMLSEEAKKKLFGFGVMLLIAAFDGKITEEERAELKEYLEQP